MTLDDYARAGIAAINEQRYDDAIRNFEAAIALDANRPDLNNALGMAYLHRGEVGSAIGPLERAVALAEPFDAPEHQDMKQHMHLGLATAYQLADRTEDALHVLRGAVGRWPHAIEPRVQLGQLLLQGGLLDEGVALYRALAEMPELPEPNRDAARAVAGTIAAFQETELDGRVFLEAHAQSYRDYFDEIAAQQEANGWYAEAARMARGPGGEPQPIIPEGARPYAMQRVDLVNPATGETASIYSETDPMIVHLNGLEVLAQVPVLFPWPGYSFDVRVCSQVPWNWLPITVAFERGSDAAFEALDDAVGSWYLGGFNGDFGDKDKGRFHFVTDLQAVGDDAANFVVDLGRARVDAIPDLMRRLTVLNDRYPIRRVIIGQGVLA